MSSHLPGAVGVSRLSVYDTTAPDGLHGGTPHMHLTCSEGYVVVAGEGHVQTLSGDGYRETPLRPGTVAWFRPGTIHRLVNEGRLQIVVLMQNSGLPEAGDAVLTLPGNYWEDHDAYRAVATLPGGDDLGPAFRRRDLAVTGFLALRAAGPDAFGDFCRFAASLVAPRVGEWRRRWEAGALDAALETGRQLDALEKTDISYLSNGGVSVLPQPTESGKHGMCGLLETYIPQGDS
ncbi:cupin domain-containing protein [Dactylosporangium darangshiense]|uniref:Cupin domain-containing protein n=1 Tax=Dactylosporangium darangshiense TaxID=579108 RepID=A0ABP8D1S6_9ACTN